MQMPVSAEERERQIVAFQAVVERAYQADSAWQVELDLAQINRWSSKSHGVIGSHMRTLFDAKVQADREMYAAFERARNANR